MNVIEGRKCLTWSCAPILSRPCDLDPFVLSFPFHLPSPSHANRLLPVSLHTVPSRLWDRRKKPESQLISSQATALHAKALPPCLELENKNEFRVVTSEFIRTLSFSTGPPPAVRYQSRHELPHRAINATLHRRSTNHKPRHPRHLRTKANHSRKSKVRRAKTYGAICRIPLHLGARRSAQYRNPSPEGTTAPTTASRFINPTQRDNLAWGNGRPHSCSSANGRAAAIYKAKAAVLDLSPVTWRPVVAAHPSSLPRPPHA